MPGSRQPGTRFAGGAALTLVLVRIWARQHRGMKTILDSGGGIVRAVQERSGLVLIEYRGLLTVDVLAASRAASVQHYGRTARCFVADYSRALLMLTGAGYEDALCAREKASGLLVPGALVCCRVSLQSVMDLALSLALCGQPRRAFTEIEPARAWALERARAWPARPPRCASPEGD